MGRQAGRCGVYLASSGQRPDLHFRGPKFTPHRLPFLDSRLTSGGIYVPFLGPTPSVVLRKSLYGSRPEMIQIMAGSQQLLTREDPSYTAVNDVTYMKVRTMLLSLQ